MSTLVPPQPSTVVDTSGSGTLRIQAARVDVVKGPQAGASVRIAVPHFIIGSGPTADLRITDDTVSREHLRLHLAVTGLHLLDEASTNGTTIGGMRIKDVILTADAHVLIGSTTLAIQLEATVTELALSSAQSFGDAIGNSEAMRHLFATLERAASSDVTVLLEGESGVGKEVLAQAVHTSSRRASGPFVAVDCGAIPPALIESELFGHERGAFTGADRAREGVFEQANGGTLFLDEIGELPLDLQPKLLRALEARQVRPVGGRGIRTVDVRIVAATNRNLAAAAQKGEFRSDLYYRLAVVRARVPPLRDRRSDILPLARAFLSRVPGYESHELAPEVASMLLSYGWPGNVRELRNVIDRYTVLGVNPAALFDRSLGNVAAPEASDLTHLPFHEARRIALERFERSYLPALLAKSDNNVSRAAVAAGIGRGSLHRMLHRVRKGESDET
jgi:transcriptional regulator with PAS, ATPase and Fis domain